jgi:hypothetical protein
MSNIFTWAGYPWPMVFNSWLLLVSIYPHVLVFTVTVTIYGARSMSAPSSNCCLLLGKPVLHYYFFMVAPFFRYTYFWAPGSPVYPCYGLKCITSIPILGRDVYVSTVMWCRLDEKIWFLVGSGHV